MAKYLTLLMICLGAITCKLFGQELPSIQLDRPDQTECPFITPKNYIQIENGFTLENKDKNQKTFYYPSSLWKFGINEKFELRLITGLISEKINRTSTTGFLPISFGFKTALFEEKGLIPKTSFIGHVTSSKFGSKEFQTKYIKPSFRFVMQHTLTNKITLAYNLGAEWNGENANHSYIYTLTTGFSITKKIGFYTELYGFIPTENKADHRFDGGFTYLINNDFIIDISGGLGLTENTQKNYIALGISYRFKTTK